MRKILYVLGVFLCPFLVAAQEATLDKLATQTCECAEKQDLSGLDDEAKSMKIGGCMIEVLQGMSKAEQEALGANMYDQASMQELGEKIGMKMAVKCPATMMQLAQTSTQMKTESRSTVQGTFAGLKSGEFAQLQLKMANGRTQSFLWLEYFEGADLMSNPSSLQGKKLRVTFAEMECYSPALEDYRQCKVLKGVKVVTD